MIGKKVKSKVFLWIIIIFLPGIVKTYSQQVDTFGIMMLYPTKAGTKYWTSVHWNNGIERRVKYSSDTYDPYDWTEDHSSQTDGFWIDGKGTMTMSGESPRFHINSLRNTKGVTQFFRDIEFTAYYQRKGRNGKSYGGMVVGVRSGPLGHGSSGGNNCDATTYYARYRNDGKWDFEKELKHPNSTYWSGSGFKTQDPLWNEKELPLNRWIGMKFVVYNINNKSVKLELYIDSVSNGNPLNGGIWKMVGSVIDSGNWPAGDVSGCDYDSNAVIIEGNGTILMRTDGDTAVYKMVSVREIDTLRTTEINLAKREFNFIRPNTHYYLFVNTNHNNFIIEKPFNNGWIYNPRGIVLQKGCRHNNLYERAKKATGMIILKL